MDLYIAVPIFTLKGSNILSKRNNLFSDWFENNRLKLRKEYRFVNISGETLSPNKALTCKVNRDNVTKIKYSKLVTKGLAIRLHILSVLDWIDRGNPINREDSYYIMIDGSGAFDFDDIFLVLDKLCGLPRYDVVLGNRPVGQTGMATWRKNVELFEEYLSVKTLGKEFISNLLDNDHTHFPDAQAGCWGLRLSAMKHLPLTAKGYEIEYDLLYCALENKIKIGYTKPLKMAQRTGTDFGDDITDYAITQCIKKLDFIVYRLGIEKSEITRFLEEFRNDSNYVDYVLPAQYIKEIGNYSK